MRRAEISSKFNQMVEIILKGNQIIIIKNDKKRKENQ